MYDGVALHGVYHITHAVLFCVAAGLWVLYLYEVLFKTGKVQTHWVKRRLTDVALMLLMALVTFLVFTLVAGLQSGHRR